ncbi:hypothetical protein SPSIL_024090 [Sporomusa silvacetica DSM 10669]|uniref:SLH domain-containing protein n=1 Tax=Sporomusa silvacetica DSM 10669 TaxID=1123289 RepID=A0ABZ3IKS2_9FIRM|nr:S-layer homology domain-containing protein [Sporomusa silvacetica]OZC13430.1 outer membrane protein alpha precursor [Sporomusa silvacetica DSM 10669]
MKKTTVLILTLVFIMGVFGTAAAANVSIFTDVTPDHWSYYAINKLYKDGIITGYGDGTFHGDRNITRYEMATMVASAMTKMDKADPENKALIQKLETEYAGELEQIGARLTKVENTINKFSITGNIRVSFGHVKDTVENNAKKVEGSIWSSRILVNVTDKIDENTTAYMRLGARDCWGADDLSVTSSWGPEIPYVNIDQYGIKYTKNGWDYTLGKQGLTMGQGLLISTGSDAEWSNQFVGLTARGKIGAVNTTVALGNTTDASHLDYYGNARATWMGVDMSAPLGHNVTLGGTYLSHKAQKPDTVNPNWAQSLQAEDMWGVNTSIKVAPHFSLNGEYVKSSYKDDNQAYTIGALYNKGKDTLMVSYSDVERNAIDPYNSLGSALCSLSGGEGFFHTDWWTASMMKNYTATRYYYAHQMNKNVYYDIFVINAKVPNSSGNDLEVFGGINYNF